jgi:hypothetical protein
LSQVIPAFLGNYSFPDESFGAGHFKVISRSDLLPVSSKNKLSNSRYEIINYGEFD